MQSMSAAVINMTVRMIPNKLQKLTRRNLQKKEQQKSSACISLTHFRLNELTHTIYWESPISIFGSWGYET